MKRLQIAVLDALLVFRQDVPLAPLEALGDVRAFPCTAYEERIDRIGDADAIFLNRVRIDAEVFERCKNLRFIGVTGTGYNMIDVTAAREAGATVCNVPGYSTAAVAEMTFALLLEIARGTSALSAYIHAGSWRDPLDAYVASAPAFELCGKTLGIVGLGQIGRRVAALGQAFGMRVLGCRRPSSAVSAASEEGGLVLCALDTVLRESDVVSVHCPLTEETRGLIGEAALARMKPGAVLLNTARGPILDSAAVARALDSGRLYAAGVDVLEHEPPRAGDPLAAHPRCVATPHAAWAPRETRARLVEACAENLRLFLAGCPHNVVL